MGKLATREPLRASRPVPFRRRRLGDHRFVIPFGTYRRGACSAASLEFTPRVFDGSRGRLGEHGTSVEERESEPRGAWSRRYLNHKVSRLAPPSLA